jgi:serine phosphatase RsbU (regulator of sigma subunit)
MSRPEMYLYKFSKDNGLPEDIFLGDIFEMNNNICIMGGKEKPFVFNKQELFDYIKSITNNKIFVSSIYANNKLLELDSNVWFTDNFVLPKNTKDISIEISTQNTPLMHYYRYRLLGFNKSWIDAGNRSHIIYNNLKPGKYTLEIKSNLSEMKIIKITIPPMWYQSFIFKVFLVFLIFIIVYVFVKIREQRLEIQNKYLEEKVFERTKQLQLKNNEILDNMRYARRIQRAMMPSDSINTDLIDDYFVFLKPKDIVSGDFFYLKDFGNKLIFAVADCTGHGVSGAFMSILSHTILHQAITRNINAEPSFILDMIRDHIKTVLHQEGGEDDTKDGMDIGLAVFDVETKILTYSGAFISLYIVKDKVLTEIKPDRQPVAYYINEKPFTKHEVKLEKGDILYLSSDGYPDQIGGKKNKRLYSRRFKKILVDISPQKLEKQKLFLNKHLEEWRGDNEQIDDVCVMAIKV